MRLPDDRFAAAAGLELTETTSTSAAVETRRPHAALAARAVFGPAAGAGGDSRVGHLRMVQPKDTVRSVCQCTAIRPTPMWKTDPVNTVGCPSSMTYLAHTSS